MKTCPACNEGFIENGSCDNCSYVYPAQFTTTTEQLCADLIEGPGGLDDFEYYEMATMNYRRDIGVAMWVVRCIGNAPGSDLAQAIKARWGEYK
jgi:hypothetical protein